MSKRYCLFLLFFLLTVPVFLFGQTADGIEFYLNTEAVSCKQAAWLVLEAANVSGDYNRFNPEEAFHFAGERRWLPRKADPSKKINLRQVSLLIMQAFDLKGGLMYAIFKTPHYAYREMVHQDIIQGRADPGMAVSGELLLFLIGQVLSRRDEVPWVPPDEEWDLAEEINTQLRASGVTNAYVELTDNGINIILFNNRIMKKSLDSAQHEDQVIQEIGRILKVIIEREYLDTDYAEAAGTGERRRKALEYAQTIVDYLLGSATLEDQ